MSSPPVTMWLEDNDLMLGEPSLMSTGICPMSVFDKFGWDSDILGPDTDELLDKICIKTEPDDDSLDSKTSTDFGSLSSIFPDLLDDNKSTLDMDGSLKPILSPSSLSSLYEEALQSPLNEKAAIVKEEEEVELEPELPDLEALVTESVPTTMMIQSPQPTNTLPNPIPNSVIRIPVKRGPGAFGIGRALKAVVVCPDRSKSIVCNVVRSTNKGIVIQKPVSRSLLNVCARNESTKLPIKVNVISSKDNYLSFGAVKSSVTTTTPVKVEPLFTTTSLSQTMMKTTPMTIVPEVKSDSNSLTSLKVEFEEIRPETPQSLIGSDEEFHPFSSPNKSTAVRCYESIEEDYIKACLLEEDNLCSESYKCMPPAEVTGQIQPVIPDIFKYTPNSSPSNDLHGDSTLESFLKTDVNTTNQQSPSTLNQFYSKAVANVDHDYGFTCRTPKTTNSIFSDSLGIQTPSASEPPTDSDDDETLLNDVSLLNKDFDCSELDREQSEYFENLKHQLKLAELMCEGRDKEHKSKNSASLKERKMAGRIRKRKLSKDRSPEHRMNTLKVASITATTSSSGSSIIGDSTNRFSTTVPTATTATTTSTLKVRLPVKDANNRSVSSNNNSNSSSLTPKRKKSGSGGRVFSPSERRLHNTNEQVRRIEMRQSFEELRRLVPNLIDKPRAPKVCILQEAKMYCDELFHSDLKLQAQVTALKCQQERLRCALSQLRRYAAASRH